MCEPRLYRTPSYRYVRIRSLARFWMWSALSLTIIPTASFATEWPADRWLHFETVPGGTACAARLAGDEVDTMLVVETALIALCRWSFS